MKPPFFPSGPVPVAAISICIAILVTAIILRLGIDATPYDTLDSQGRRLGFNDPISGEHYRIIIGNFHPSLLWKPARLYDLLLLIMQITGIKLLWSRGNANAHLCRWFFVLQPVIFPIGLAGIVYLPTVVWFMVNEGIDREGFVDAPFIAFVSQGAWLMVSLALWLRAAISSFKARRDTEPSLSSREYAEWP